MTQPTDIVEDLASLVAAAWAGAEEARGSLKPRFPTAKKLWRKFPSRPARAFSKSPKSFPSKKSSGRFKKNCGANTAWATRLIKQLPKLDITRSTLQPSRKT